MTGVLEPGLNKVIQSRYRKVVAWAVLLTIVCIPFLVTGVGHDAFIQPGKVTTPHTGVSDCGSCHIAADRGPLAWLHDMDADTAAQNSQLCLSCHSLGDSALFAHSVPPVSLQHMTTQLHSAGKQKQTPIITAAQMLDWTPEAGQQLQCKTCHHEHSGNRRLITADSSTHCQSCHAQSFDSFGDGHPEFASYPFGRRTRVNFDHVSHLAGHFNEQGVAEFAPQTCLACHSVSNAGNEMQTLGFEQNCSSCHAEEIRGQGRATELGIEVLMVPGLDADSLAANNIDIGEWPATADESLSPFMQLLLRSDAHYATVKPVLESVDLLDLNAVNAQQLQAVATLAWCIKMLFNDIVQGGGAFLQQRLEASLGRRVDDSRLAALLATLPKAVIQSASQEWFPDLTADIERHRSGTHGPIATSESTFDTSAAIETQTVSLADNTELGDALLDEEAIFDEAALWDDNDSGEQQTLPATVTDLSEEQWVKAGGWYRDDFTLRYRPIGHADGFIRNWLDLTANVAIAAPLFDQLSNSKAPGNCMRCHSIDRDGNGQLLINWRSDGSRLEQASKPRHFTRFRHAPHLNLQEENGCQTCHALNSDADYAASFAQHDVFQFNSNFHSIEKSRCESCHNETAENQNCLSCHRYHVTDLQPVIKGDLLRTAVH